MLDSFNSKIRVRPPLLSFEGSHRINRSLRENGERRLLEPLPEPATFFLRLLLLERERERSAPFSLCVFTEIGEAAGRLQRLQILVALLGTVVPGKTVRRPVSSSYLRAFERGAALHDFRGVGTQQLEDTSKKGGHPEGRRAKLIKSTLLSIDGDSWTI